MMQKVTRLMTVLGMMWACTSSAVFAQTHAPWPTDWNNWADPALWVTVGNPGNAADTRYETPGYGSVESTYRISKFEVTAGEYTEFLNAVAATDTYNLYNGQMLNDDHGCKIERHGTAPGNYTYSVAPDRANRPVNYVSWGDAARFCNWLSNGQATGAQGLATTEDGSYYLNGAMTNAELLEVTRKPDALYVIPSEHEWYKAAYYDSSLNDGAGGYWDYPTGPPPLVPSNDLIDPDPGNNANYHIAPSDDTIGSPYWRTEVGEFENSESPHGTFDQGGNVWEWNEAIIDNQYRGVRGGTYNALVDRMRASYRNHELPSDDNNSLGFRIAIPEPASIALLAFGGCFLMKRRRRPRA